MPVPKKKVDFHYTVTNKFSQLCKCNQVFPFEIDFLKLEVFAYVFACREALEVNFSDCFPLWHHSDVHSQTGSNIVCDTKRDLSLRA